MGEDINRRQRRCALYGRVSTDRQAQIQDGGLDTQFALMEQRIEYEKAHAAGRVEWLIVDRYREAGQSGKSLDRPQFKRMMADITAGKIDVVLVHKLDRITRSLRDFYDLWETFDKLGIEFISLNERFDTTNAMGRAMVKFMLVFAELEREQTGERTAATMEHRARQGLRNGGRIIGYDLFAEDGRKGVLVPNAEQAQLVREEVFEKFLELGSASAVVRHLDALGRRTPEYMSRRKRKQGGKRFTKTRVLSILGNPVYVGKLRWKDEVVAAQHDAIISDALFERVQRQLQQNRMTFTSAKHDTERVYLLQGLLRCGVCGAKLTPYWGVGRSKPYYYYQCSGRNRSVGTDCSAKSVPADAAEDLIVAELSRLALSEDELDAIARHANGETEERLGEIERQRKTVRNGLAANRTKTQPLVTALEEGTPLSAVRDRLIELENERTNLDEQLAQLDIEQQQLEQTSLSAEVMADSYRSLPEIMAAARAAGDREGLKDLVRGYVEAIDWHRDPADDRRGRLDVMLFEQPCLALEVARGGTACAGRFEQRQDWLPEQDSNL